VRNPTFITLSDGTIRNTYEVRLRNKHGDARPFRVTVSGHPSVRVALEGTPYQTVEVPPNAQRLQRVYLLAPAGSEPAESERLDLRLWVEDISNGDRAYKDTIFNGKGNQ
jgi:polyferredoxin